MTDREPTPLERTQLIEIWLNKWVISEVNHESRSWLDRQVVVIGSALGGDVEIKSRLDVLRNHITELKYANDRKSPDAEEIARDAASAANLDLRRVIAERTVK